MSAAEPAIPPTPPTAVNTGESAAVIPLEARRVGRQANKRRGWRMDTPPARMPGPSSQPADRDTELQLVAEEMEMAFNAFDDRTLTDRETAVVFVHTLNLVGHALKGAAAGGIISEEQRAELAVLIEGMAQAPRLV